MDEELKQSFLLWLDNPITKIVFDRLQDRVNYINEALTNPDVIVQGTSTQMRLVGAREAIEDILNIKIE